MRFVPRGGHRDSHRDAPLPPPRLLHAHAASSPFLRTLIHPDSHPPASRRRESDQTPRKLKSMGTSGRSDVRPVQDLPGVRKNVAADAIKNLSMAVQVAMAREQGQGRPPC